MGTPIEGGQVQGNEGTVENGAPEAPGPNPAWNDVLGLLPEQFHPVVTPHFQKWDQAAQSRIEQANQQVQAFQAYQPFVEHGIDPQELENGLRLMYEINNNPQGVWEALAQTYNLSPEVVANAAGAGGEAGTENEGAQQQIQDPRFEQLNGQLELVSQIILQDQQAKVEASADAELDRELADLKQRHGDYDERYVLALMQNGASGEEAVQAFTEFRNGLLQGNPRPFAPNVMGSSGGGNGYPSQQLDPTKLSGNETRNLVAQMLEAAARQQ